MKSLILQLRRDYPALKFIEGNSLCWSPSKMEIYYDPLAGITGAYGVLHEIGHACLSHASYDSDTDLLTKEVLAWDEAIKLAKKYCLTIDETHIQDCLDTYREWLYKRSSCPSCGAKGLQKSPKTYSCLNCEDIWQVSKSRFCRPYRQRPRIS